ncbi:outer membrane beta-barrel family protein [Robiginitalea sp. M366]|uniref:outer membrane beta-barrel family protein n=1 Tax=Robiginitalea aestuariiviva TaxID=3036903 RepID=UPI00240D13E9|nr:outer membrane beta-barrel family protein [Robiginitalea aestuariiviva]MDG1573202.1 outer membrane beta-barrel family protein [Robiginitalea aestuariiviva]
MKTCIRGVALVLTALITLSASLPDPEPDLKVGSVSGTVLDPADQQPVAYAAIVIRSAADSTLVTGGITEDNGHFSIEKLPEGTFVLEVQFIGYKTYHKEFTITRSQRKVEIGTITLEAEATALEGVEVVAERTTIEQKVDRKVINVGKDLTTAGATASDIMNNIPSVNLDQQSGEITMRGNANVRVMVDGKLSNVPVAQLLRQIPSTSIKSIELITNPSAKYNPEGMSGIINIVLHKNANIGFNGNLNLGLTKGLEAKFNNSLDLNYRYGKFNLYGNAGTNIGNYVNDGRLDRTAEQSRQLIDVFNNNKSYLYKLGVDFYLNDKNTISFFTNQNYFDGQFTVDTQVDYLNNPQQNLAQFLLSDSDNHSQQYNFDYKLLFGREGQSLELEVDHNLFESEEAANFDLSGAYPYPDYQDFVDTERTQTTVNLDYVAPIDSLSRVELGVQARLFETDTDYRSTGQTYNAQGQLAATPSTAFLYDMDIYSAYATYSRTAGPWSYQLGVRVEQVEVQADTNQTRAFTDRYTEIYPSGFLTYSPGEKNQFQLSVSRRVDRPGLSQVNPIREFSTPLISSFGNPSLLPQFTYSYELNYTRRFGLGSLTAGVFYRTITDEINRALFLDRLDLNRIVLTFDNFDDTSAYGVELSSNLKPAAWWNINASFDLYNQTQRGFSESLPTDIQDPGVDDIQTAAISVDNTAWNLRMNNSFKATKALTFQLFGFYRGRNRSLQFEQEPMYFINTGARYSFAQGKGTLSLNVNDVFNWMQAQITAGQPIPQQGRFTWESRTLYMGLAYRFGSGKNRALSRKRRDSNTKQGGGGLF